MRDERRFKMADKDGDLAATKEEFTAFLHPEEYDYMKDIVVQVGPARAVGTLWCRVAAEEQELLQARLTPAFSCRKPWRTLTRTAMVSLIWRSTLVRRCCCSGSPLSHVLPLTESSSLSQLPPAHTHHQGFSGAAVTHVVLWDFGDGFREGVSRLWVNPWGGDRAMGLILLLLSLQVTCTARTVTLMSPSG